MSTIGKNEYGIDCFTIKKTLHYLKVRVEVVCEAGNVKRIQELLKEFPKK